MTEPTDAIIEEQPPPPSEKQLTQAVVDQQTAIIRQGVASAGKVDVGILLAMLTLQGQQIRVLTDMLVLAPDGEPCVLDADDYHRRVRVVVQAAVDEFKRPKIAVARGNSQHAVKPDA